MEFHIFLPTCKKAPAPKALGTFLKNLTCWRPAEPCTSPAQRESSRRSGLLPLPPCWAAPESSRGHAWDHSPRADGYARSGGWARGWRTAEPWYKDAGGSCTGRHPWQPQPAYRST